MFLSVKESRNLTEQKISVMIYFTPDFLQFFKELGANNNKDWFDANRKRYETEVKDPFKKLVSDLIIEIRNDEPELLVEAKDCIFRINRDIRFSKDKTPYKTQVSAVISPGGRKNMNIPGLYLELTAERIAVYGGLYMPNTKLLNNVRMFIADNVDSFKKAYSNKEFVDRYGKIQGEKNKRIDKAFTQKAEQEPLLYNKQFYYYAHLPVKLLNTNRLVPSIMEYYNASAPIKEFLREATM